MNKFVRRRGAAGSFPWRYGNRFRLLIDGEQLFARMIAAIGGARHYVLIEMYLVESGRVVNRFVDALLGAAARGVRVSLLFDGFGSLGLSPEDRRRLRDGGVELRFYNVPRWRKMAVNLLRNHRKLLLVDGDIAFIGGVGLTDHFDGGGHYRGAWRETMVEVWGPVVADWETLFLRTWRRCGGQAVAWATIPCAAIADGAAGRLTTSAGWHRAELADSIAHRIDTAHARVWIASPYFVPSRRFRKALRRAARRGVDVRLLASGPLTDQRLVRHAARRFFGKLLRSGVHILEYQPRVLHAKMVLCDDWASIGSSNLDRWSLKWNLEANQEIEHRPFAGQLAAVFENDFRHSLELDRTTWPKRTWLDRLYERAAGVLDRALEKWRRPKSF